MPWIRITLGRFGFGLSKEFPPALVIGWIHLQWVGKTYFMKTNKALIEAEKELTHE